MTSFDSVPGPPIVQPAALERAHRAAWAGLAFALLYTAGLLILETAPDHTASDAELVSFYEGTGRRLLTIAGGYLIPFAGIAFLWFLAALRHRTLHAAGIEDPLLSTVQLLSGVLFVAMVFVSAATAVSTALAIDLSSGISPDPGQTRQQLALSRALLMVYAMRSGAIFIAAGTTRARRAGLVPHWFLWISYLAAGLLVLTVTYFQLVSLVIPLWVAGASLLIMRRLPNMTSATPA